MHEWVTGVMEQFGYLGVFLMILLENLFPPIPSELVLPFAGFMTTTTSLALWGVVASATLGSVLGATILYGVGRVLDVPTLDRLVGRWGHILRVRTDDIHKADSWFQRYGYWAVFFGRMVPVVRSLISIPAGMAHMNFGLFILFTAVGTFIWNVVLAGAGALLGESWEEILRFMDVYSTITYIVLALAALALVVLLITRVRDRSANRRR